MKTLGVAGGLKGLKSFQDFALVGMEAFPRMSNFVIDFARALKTGDGAVGKFKGSMTALNTAMKANPIAAVIAGVVALIAVIKIVDSAIDKANDSTNELLEKKDGISKNLSEIDGELEEVQKQIDELNKQLPEPSFYLAFSGCLL